MTEDLPHGWTWATPEDLASDQGHSLGIGPFGSDLTVPDYTNSGVPLVFVRNIRSETFGGVGDKFISEQKAERLRAHRVTGGDLLITKMGDPPGDACLYPDGLPDAIMTADCIRVRLRDVFASKKFFVYAIRSHAVRDQILDRTTGVAQQKISLERFKTIRVPMAPLPEQDRIVDSIESHLSRLDDAVATLERVQRNLKRYRASVLKAAVEGRLVPTEAELARAEGRDYEPASRLLERILLERRRRWEDAELARMRAAGKPPKDDTWKERYVTPAAPDVRNLATLPDGWCWATGEQVSEFITKGTTPSAEFLSSGNGDVPYIKVYNLTTNGTLDFSLDPTFVTRDVHISALTRSIARPGDVLMNIVGPPLGKVSIVPDSFPEWNINQAIARYRPIPGLEIPFLSLVLRSDQAIAWMKGKAKATSGQFNLTLEICRQLPMPLPSQAEQRRIVGAVQEAESQSEHALQTTAANLKRCARLRQSILKWAFEGKLADQDPTDEPASALLARIRAERAAAETTKKPAARGRPKKTAAATKNS